jgi:tetratricopeptide (TPR) repeat protein
MAERVQSDLALAGAHNAMGATHLWMGEFPAAREHLEITANILDRDITRYLPMMQAPVTPNRCNLAWALHIAGFPEQAKRRMIESGEFAAQLGRPFSLAFYNMYAIVLQHFRREYDDIRPRSEALIELAREKGLPHLLAAGKMCLARTMAGEGHFLGDEVAVNIGLTLLQEAKEKLVENGADLIHSFSLILLAEVYLMMKRPEEGLAVLDDAQQRSEQMDHRLLEAEIHRLRGETMLLLPDGAAKAEQSFRRAIDIAQKSGARAWELRAATSLATLLAKNSQRDQGRAALNSALAQFTEGFDTYDLIQAKSLIADLA